MCEILEQTRMTMEEALAVGKLWDAGGAEPINANGCDRLNTTLLEHVLDGTRAMVAWAMRSEIVNHLLPYEGEAHEQAITSKAYHVHMHMLLCWAGCRRRCHLVFTWPVTCLCRGALSSEQGSGGSGERRQRA